MLLAAGADVHAATRSGDTALHWAAFSGNVEIARLILEHGANVDAVGELANRPLHVAATKNQDAVVGLLLAHNACVAFKNVYGNTAAALTTSPTISGWIKRVREGGSGERQKLAGELAAAAAEAVQCAAAAQAAQEAE